MDFTKQERFPPMKNSSNILKDKTVAIIGIGGLGSHSVESLVRMGVGHIVLVENDIIENSNLPRQGLYTLKDSLNQTFKLDAAYHYLKEINPLTRFTLHKTRLNQNNIASILKNVDVVVDGTDNLQTRYLINDYCYENNIPWVYCSATASLGTVINFIPGKTPCFRCVLGEETEEDNTTCDINGVFLPILTFITSIQVTEVIKILLDKDPSLQEIRYDIWTREEISVNTSIFLEEDCSCQTKKFTNKNDKMYFICSGDSIQVNTDLDLTKIEEKIEQWGFKQSKQNELLIEATNGSERIVGFNNGKIIFHNINKEKIQQLF